jgi:hypothetical protein
MAENFVLRTIASFSDGKILVGAAVSYAAQWPSVGFTHRQEPHGTTVSICLLCFEKVAWSSASAPVGELEAQHVACQFSLRGPRLSDAGGARRVAVVIIVAALSPCTSRTDWRAYERLLCSSFSSAPAQRPVLSTHHARLMWQYIPYRVKTANIA